MVSAGDEPIELSESLERVLGSLGAPAGRPSLDCLPSLGGGGR